MEYEDFRDWVESANDTCLSKIPTDVLKLIEDRFKLYRKGQVQPIVDAAYFIYKHKKGKIPDINQFTEFIEQIGVFSTIENLNRKCLMETNPDFDLFKFQRKHKKLRAKLLQDLPGLFW